MQVQRQDPPVRADEKAMLEAWLEFQRATLELKCAGLSPQQLAERSVPPSNLSLLGLVRHLAQVERNWFRVQLGGEDAPPLFYPLSDPQKGFDRVEASEADSSLATWRAECAHSRALLARVDSPDQPGRQLRRGEPVSVRWLLLHTITEYARHLGHADLLRERLDGSVGR
jgi:uncharacterized damage-inducible protein DinB